MVTKEDIIRTLSDKGFVQINPKGPYEVLRMKGEGNVILYTTGKLSIQGTQEQINYLNDLLERTNPRPKPSRKKSAPRQQTLTGIQAKTKMAVIVGSDETLKGDTFGGLVVAGFKAGPAQREKLQQLHVTDSKTYSDTQIQELANTLKKEFSHNYHIENLYPKEYNEKAKEIGSTRLMNQLHHKVNEALKESGSLHVVDLYPGCRVGDVMETRAESSYPEVAAASILARDTGLQQFEKLQQNAGMRLPKGSTHVQKALILMKKKKLDVEKFAKTGFSNVKKIFAQASSK